jgi:hypothetical protein
MTRSHDERGARYLSAQPRRPPTASGPAERVNEPSAENPERMGEQELWPEAVGMEGCVVEGEGRGLSTGFAAAAR